MQRITRVVASISKLNLFSKQVRHHSAVKPLAGAASAAGTKRRFELTTDTKTSAHHDHNTAAHHHGHHHSATRQRHAALTAEHLRPWSMGWTASHVGFGAYRVHDHAHYHALMRALELGCNVIDTSANYSDGGSEHVIGDVIHEMTRHLKVLQRDELIVISKFGYVQNSNLQWARDQESQGKAFPDMVKLSEQMWYCLSAPWIEQQLTQTLARLNLETLDVYLLHNPEHYLRPDTSLQAWEAALEQAFAALEKEVARGRIQFYGVSSNVWSRDQLDLDRMLNIAKKVKGNEHHFRVIQFPLNLLEHDALQSTNGQPALIDRAQQAKLVTLSNRPLNALVEGQLARLVMPEIQPTGKDLTAELHAAFEQALNLEREYSATAAYHVPDAQINVAHTLHKHLAYFDLYKFESFIRDSVAPHLNHVLGDDGKLPASSEFKAWLQRYQVSLERLWSTLFTLLALHRYQQSSHVYRTVVQTPAFASRAPHLHSLALLATNAVLSTPVDCMLIGMRSEHYVEEVFNHHLTAPLGTDRQLLVEAMLTAQEAAKYAHVNMKLDLAVNKDSNK